MRRPREHGIDNTECKVVSVGCPPTVVIQSWTCTNSKTYCHSVTCMCQLNIPSHEGIVQYSLKRTSRNSWQRMRRVGRRTPIGRTKELGLRDQITVYVHPVTHGGTLFNASATSCTYFIVRGTRLLRRTEKIGCTKRLHDLGGASESKVVLAHLVCR